MKILILGMILVLMTGGSLAVIATIPDPLPLTADEKKVMEVRETLRLLNEEKSVAVVELKFATKLIQDCTDKLNDELISGCRIPMEKFNDPGNRFRLRLGVALINIIRINEEISQVEDKLKYGIE